MSGLGLGGLFLQIGGAASSAIGSYYSAATQKINLKTQANLADINAKIAELGAQSALLQGQQQVGRGLGSSRVRRPGQLPGGVHHLEQAASDQVPGNRVVGQRLRALQPHQVGGLTGPFSLI